MAQEKKSKKCLLLKTVKKTKVLCQEKDFPKQF